LTRAKDFDDFYQTKYKKRISSNKNIMDIYYSEKAKEKKRLNYA